MLCLQNQKRWQKIPPRKLRVYGLFSIINYCTTIAKKNYDYHTFKQTLKKYFIEKRKSIKCKILLHFLRFLSCEAWVTPFVFRISFSHLLLLFINISFHFHSSLLKFQRFKRIRIFIATQFLFRRLFLVASH